MAMEIKENIAGLGKNHDKDAQPHDIAKKQSEAKPAVENLDAQPNSVNTKGQKGFLANNKAEVEQKIENVHQAAKVYAKEEHKKADNWEDHGKAD